MGKNKIILYLLIGLIFLLILFVNCNSKNSYYGKKIDFLHFQNLLLAKEFDQLNNELDELQKEFIVDFKSEFRLVDAYNVFGLTSPDLESIFNEWVEKYPDFYQPYVARAQYFHRLGWNARGYKLVYKTTREQFSKMEIYFERADRDAKKALELEKNCFIPYIILIGINSGGNFSDSKSDLIKAGLKINPNSVILRARYLWFLQPKWGGSISKMDSFIKQSEQFYDTNPTLKVLKGFPYMSNGSNYYFQKQYKKAEELHKKALSFGDYHIFYWQITYTYLKLKKYKEALNAINRAIELYPHHMYFSQMRTSVYLKLKDIPNAQKDHNWYNKIFPYSRETHKYNRWFSEYLTVEAYKLYKKMNFEMGLEKINMAVKVDKANHKALYWRGKIYIKTRRLELALQDFKNAIKIDPTYYFPYKSIDSILIRKRKYNEIISYWTQYINLVPTNADAYLERSGTFYHKGDYISCLMDAKKAAELKKEYQLHYEKLKIKISQKKR